MPKIYFQFSGYLSAEIKSAFCVSTLEDIDVSKLTSKELLDLIVANKILLSFDDCLDNAYGDFDVEMFDYEEGE